MVDRTAGLVILIAGFQQQAHLEFAPLAVQNPGMLLLTQIQNLLVLLFLVANRLNLESSLLSLVSKLLLDLLLSGIFWWISVGWVGKVYADIGGAGAGGSFGGLSQHLAGSMLGEFSSSPHFTMLGRHLSTGLGDLQRFLQSCNLALTWKRFGLVYFLKRGCNLVFSGCPGRCLLLISWHIQFLRAGMP